MEGDSGRISQILHAKFSCKIYMKFSGNIGGPKEEQLILNARSRSSKESERVLHRICDTLKSVTQGALLLIFCNMYEFEA